ncbi:MAG TPA: Spy/CpxP family protein refolding chaperone [Bryobacteraceae bacterium]|nr:Spy/CpxP family protein refolding chaperone [Bryobacteraceae bacterium]
MKRHLMNFATVAALAAGMAFAQAPPAAPATGSRPAQTGKHARRFMRWHRMAKALNLTDAQKQQAKSIFQEARQTSQPLAQQLKENRQALMAAVKAGKSDAEIQQLSATQGSVLGQLIAVRTTAASKFYATLTPDQRTKADQMQQQFRQRMGQHRNHPNNG